MAHITISETSAALLAQLWLGMRDEHGDLRSQAELVDDAIARVHRGFFGLPFGDPDGPSEPTGPFRKWASDRPAEVMLREVDPKTFRLAQPFRYNDGTRQFDVPENDVTDLASVPRFLTWLVPRYGRHTFAALLHDHLQDVPTVSSETADNIFRNAMGDTGVPLSRRWLMWSAVALRTQWKMGGLRSLRVLLWVLVFGLAPLILWPTMAVRLRYSFGWATLGWGVVAVLGAVAAPVLLSCVWGRLWRLGAVGGTALMFITVQVVLVLFALGIYAAVEWSVERIFVKPPERNPVLTRHL